MRMCLPYVFSLITPLYVSLLSILYYSCAGFPRSLYELCLHLYVLVRCTSNPVLCMPPFVCLGTPHISPCLMSPGSLP